MSIDKVSPETIALASSQHPSKLNVNNQSVAEKAAERNEGEIVKSESAVTRGRGIKVDVDS
jgi:hypothetical protein